MKKLQPVITGLIFALVLTFTSIQCVKVNGDSGDPQDKSKKPTTTEEPPTLPTTEVIRIILMAILKV